jgi:hypothetical protein
MGFVFPDVVAVEGFRFQAFECPKRRVFRCSGAEFVHGTYISNMTYSTNENSEWQAAIS